MGRKPPEVTDLPEYVPTRVAAEITGMNRETLRKYWRSGAVRRHQINTRVVRWHRGDLLRLIGADPNRSEP